MAYRLYGAKPLSETMWEYCQLYHQELTSVKFSRKQYIVIPEYAFENIVCEIAVIWSRGGGAALASTWQQRMRGRVL